MNNTYHFTYQTKNLINGKTYVGVHSTDDLADGYIGSGKVLKQAIKKYGKSNFVCTPLSFFDTRKEAYEEEKYIVDKNWVNESSNYNQCVGGEGGVKWRPFGELNPNYQKNTSDETKNKISKSLTGLDAPWKRLPKSEESNKKRSESCPHKVKVYQYDFDGNFIMEHESVTACAKHHGLDKIYITNVLGGSKKSYNGFQFTREFKESIKPYKRENTLSDIQQYDLEGNLLKNWDSVKNISESLGIRKNSIYRVLNGHRKSTNGFVFKKTDK